MKQRSRFTLVELLMVMVVMIILMGLAVGVTGYVTRRAAEAKTISLLEQMMVALEQYREDRGYYPIKADPVAIQWDEDDFKSKKGILYLGGYPADGNDDDDNTYLDGFGEPFYYEYPGTMNPEAYDLWSKGTDGNHGVSGVNDDSAGSTDDEGDAQTADADDSDDIANWKRN